MHCIAVLLATLCDPFRTHGLLVPRWCTLQSGFAGGKKCAKAVRLTPDTDFSKMRVGQMRDILRDRGVSCPECAEKQDFVAKLRELARASA